MYPTPSDTYFFRFSFFSFFLSSFWRGTFIDTIGGFGKEYFYHERNQASRPMSRVLGLVKCLVALSRFSHALHECRLFGSSALPRLHAAKENMLLADWSDGLV